MTEELCELLCHFASDQVLAPIPLFQKKENLPALCAPVLLRELGIFIAEEERFASPLKVKTYEEGVLIDPNLDGNEEAEAYQFSVSWKRSEEPSKRMWSTSACSHVHVNGRIEISPCVVLTGDLITEELLSLLTPPVFPASTQ